MFDYFDLTLAIIWDIGNIIRIIKYIFIDWIMKQTLHIDLE